MQTMNLIIKQLQEKKLRKTKLRILILQAMLKSDEPLSVEKILDFVAKNKFHSHKTSVYRQLPVLQKENIIKEVQFGENKKRYEISLNTHHHHLVCTNCDSVQDMDSENDLDKLEEKIMKEKKFKITSHSLEFFGLCKKCF